MGHRADVLPDLVLVQAGASPETLARSWKAQRRLHARYVHLVHAGGKAAPEAVVAVARELAGFVWAEMTAACAGLHDPPEPVACRDARRGRNDPRK